MFGTILTWLGNLLGGPFINAALDAYKAKLAAGTSVATLENALALRDLELRQREDDLNAQVLVAEQSNWVTRWIRPLWALPFVIYTWKLVVWDKVLGHLTGGSTDPLTGGMETMIVTVAGAYFIGRSVETVARTLKGWAGARPAGPGVYGWWGASAPPSDVPAGLTDSGAPTSPLSWGRNRDLTELTRLVTEVNRKVSIIVRQGTVLMVDFARINAAVAAQTQVEPAVETLLKELTAAITDLKANVSQDPATQAAIDALAAQIEANNTAAQAAVVANTPAVANPAPPPAAPPA